MRSFREISSVALLILVLSSGSAVAFRPFSWEPSPIFRAQDGVYEPDVLIVPEGLSWIVEYVSGYYAGSDNPELLIVSQMAPPDSNVKQTLYLAPAEQINDDLWIYRSEVTARYSGEIEAKYLRNALGQTGGTPTISMIGFLTPILAGDYSGDGIVNAADYTVLRDEAQLWEPSDLQLFRTNYGSTTGQGGASVPEPCTLLLASLMTAIASRLDSRWNRTA